MLHDVDEAETKEVKWDVHEVRGAVWHQTDYVRVGSNDLGISVCRDMLLNLSHPLSLLHIQSFALEDNLLGELVGHLVLELEEDLK